MSKLNGLKCILLVDDDEITNMIHKRIIESTDPDLHVQTVSAGQEALDYLLGRHKDPFIKPGIIFLDINMPGMNGWEFLERYHELSDEYKVKAVVVMLTTSVDPEDRVKAAENPDIKKFVNKTLTRENLEEIIEHHFGSES